MTLVYSAYPIHREPQNFTDYLSRTFPPFVRCKLERQILINNEREDELGCHLLLMDIYDKMFVFIWLWLAFLIVITAITVLALFLWVMPPFNRLFLCLQTDSQHAQKLRKKMIKKYSFSDLYALYLIKRHRSEAQFIMLMSKLVHCEESCEILMELEKKTNKVTFQDETPSNTHHMSQLSPRPEWEKWHANSTLHFTPISAHDENIRSRRVDSSTPNPDCDNSISYPRQFTNYGYKV